MNVFLEQYLQQIINNEYQNLLCENEILVSVFPITLNAFQKSMITHFLPLKPQIKKDQKLGKVVLEKILKLPENSIQIEQTNPFVLHSKQTSIDNWKVNATIQIGGQKTAEKPCYSITLKLDKTISLTEFLPTGKKRTLLTQLLIPTFLADDALYKVRIELIDSDKLFKVASTIQNGRVGISTII